MGGGQVASVVSGSVGLSVGWSVGRLDVDMVPYGNRNHESITRWLSTIFSHIYGDDCKVKQYLIAYRDGVRFRVQLSISKNACSSHVSKGKVEEYLPRK